MRILVLISCLFFANSLGAQLLTDSQKAELGKIAVNIEVDSHYASGNWESLLPSLEGKSMVLLGEFDHESKEVFQARNDLIEFLHKKCDFDVILFESGIGEMGVIDLLSDSISANQMALGLFGPWRTESLAALMSFIKRSDISVGGFDVQRTNSSLVSEFLHQSLQKIDRDSHHIFDLENRYSAADKKLRDRDADFDSIAPPTQILIDDFSNLDRLLSDIPNPDIALTLLRRAIINRQKYLKYRLTFVKDQNWKRRWEARDRAMADNVQWLRSHRFPDRKIILIAHNYHIAKHNEQEKVMGEFLKRRYADELYVLGVFAGAGSKIKNNGDVEFHAQPDSTHLDIKHIVRELDGRAHFLPIPSFEDDEESWLNTDITINDTFIDLNGSNQMILADHFDGLLLLDSVSTSVKLW